MRKINLILILLLLIVLSSCMESLPKRFNSFVTSIEDVYPSVFSEEYWMKTDSEFKKLYYQYQENKSNYTSDEKRVINSAIARYEFKRIDSFVSYVEEFSEEFTEDDWLTANERFLELVRDYKENRHAYNSSEKRKIDSVILHYCGIVIRSKIPGITNKIRLILLELGLSF